MKQIALFCFVLMMLGCRDKTISNDKLHYINGYWEIEEVVFPDGTKKNYTVNPSIDFIQLEGKEGFRKKMQPKFDGTYITSHDAELLYLQQVDATFILRYSNEFDDWEETLVHLDSLSFSVKNKEGVLYKYKRFRPISIPK